MSTNLDLSSKINGVPSPRHWFRPGAFVSAWAGCCLLQAWFMMSVCARAQTELIQYDINTNVTSQISESFGTASLPTGVFIQAFRHGIGHELWKVDESAGGLSLVMDLNPGRGNGSWGPMPVLGNRMYFSGDDGVHGNELWSSDGTPAGTSMVVELVPGAFPTVSDTIECGNADFVLRRYRMLLAYSD